VLHHIPDKTSQREAIPASGEMEKAAARRLLFKIQGQNQRYMSGGQHRGAGLSARGDEIVPQLFICPRLVQTAF
jgi:hypothetical protein